MPKIRTRIEQSALTQSILKSLLKYSAETGVFTWATRSSNKLAGSVAGHLDSRGYWRIKIQGTSFRAHRLAWLYAYGAWPPFSIDHIDGNKANNAIENLRDGSDGVNQQNVRRAQRNNSSRFLGVSKRSDCNKYRAMVSVKGKLRCIGSFDSPEEAHAAYLNEKRRLHAGCSI